MDWSDGSYEHTAETLLAAAEAGVESLGITPGARVLDLGCGTGNAALAAARRGAQVVAVDPAARLVEVARRRASEQGLSIEAVAGDAGAIPSADGAFDALVSIFAVIFAPDPDRAADEMVRVVRPGGRIALTTWTPRGPIAEAGSVLRAAMSALAPPPAAPAKPPPWGDEAAVRALFESRGARVTVERRSLPFGSASAEAWFAEQEANHPVWRFVHRALADEPARWEAIRAKSVAALSSGNEAPDGFRVTSEYLLVTAERGA